MSERKLVAVAIVCISVMISIAMAMGYDSALYGTGLAVITALTTYITTKAKTRKDVEAFYAELEATKATIRAWIPTLEALRELVPEDRRDEFDAILRGLKQAVA